MLSRVLWLPILYMGLVCVYIHGSDELSILIKMIPEQEQFFKEHILAGFEKKTGTKINVTTFSDNWDLKKKLESSEHAFSVVKVPMGMAQSLVVDRLVTPMDKFLSAAEINKVEEDYFLIDRGMYRGRLYYIPRKFETRIMVYRKSKVLDAVMGWPDFRPEIDARLKIFFSGGLPSSYRLEKDPNEWDYLDVLVAGYFWANQEYNGKRSGRIAHRGKEYSGTAVGLMDRCFQMGAKSGTLMNTQSKFFNDVLFWEAIYATYQVYNDKSWIEGWDGQGLWKAMQEEKIFLSYLTQLDCYNLMGINGKPSMMGDPGDLAFAIMPKGLTSDGDGMGNRSVSTGGWLWGIGTGSEDYKKAYELIKYITNRKNQMEECSRFGIIPVRKEILKASHPGFKEEWKIAIYNTSIKQLRINKTSYLPYANEIKTIERRYIDTWKEVLAMASKGPVKKIMIRALQRKSNKKDFSDKE